jgi:hypothetical protein
MSFKSIIRPAQKEVIFIVMKNVRCRSDMVDAS